MLLRTLIRRILIILALPTTVIYLIAARWLILFKPASYLSNIIYNATAVSRFSMVESEQSHIFPSILVGSSVHNEYVQMHLPVK